MRDRSGGSILQRAKHPNTVADARTFAQKMADRYGGAVPCAGVRPACGGPRLTRLRMQE